MYYMFLAFRRTVLFLFHFWQYESCGQAPDQSLKNKSVEPTFAYLVAVVEGPKLDKLRIILHTRPDMEYLFREPELTA